MNLSIEQLFDLILNKSEQIEESIKENSDLKELTTRQLQCLKLVMELGNPTLSELANKLHITRPSVSVMIDRLAENGYLLKVKSDSDRRSAHVHLTTKGEEAAQLHSRVHRKFSELLTRNLTDSEKDILVVILNKAIGSFEMN